MCNRSFWIPICLGLTGGLDNSNAFMDVILERKIYKNDVKNNLFFPTNNFFLNFSETPFYGQVFHNIED